MPVPGGSIDRHVWPASQSSARSDTASTHRAGDLALVPQSHLFTWHHCLSTMALGVWESKGHSCSFSCVLAGALSFDRPMFSAPSSSLNCSCYRDIKPPCVCASRQPKSSVCQGSSSLARGHLALPLTWTWGQFPKPIRVQEAFGWCPK